MRKIVAVIAVACALGAHAEERTVSMAQELYEAITALKYFSPARGKGVVMDWMTDALDIRQDPAFPRLRDGAVDIGCYQCWLDPVGLWFSIR